jgi:subtilisin
MEAFFLGLARPVAASASGTAAAPARAQGLKVLDSVHENGAKLVELDGPPTSIRAMQPGVRIVPVIYRRTAAAPRPVVLSTPKTTAALISRKTVLRVTAAGTGKPVAGADVIAFTDFARQVGDSRTTNAKGEVSLRLGRARTIERLYVFPKANLWGLMKKNLKTAASMAVQLTPLDLAAPDALRFFHAAPGGPGGDGAGVKVGVIDTGVAAHPDLTIAGGFNAVTGEQPSDFGDNGTGGHGTHVAGIIAAQGQPPVGVTGLAPGVELQAYRVFGRNSDGASNFAIVKAIDRAVTDGCDLINMSLGGGPPDEATHDAIADARAKGTLVIVAAGNDEGGPVSFPASDSSSIAVSAMGRKGTFPKSSTHVDTIGSRVGADPDNFFAAFSNVGPEIDLTGPGVAIVSTVPAGHAAMDGTSMACPAVTGAAARLLSLNPQILALPRNQIRSDEIARIVFSAATLLNFGATFEGQGRVQA